MCPACVASVLLAVAVATSAGGAAGLVVKELGARRGATKAPPKSDSKERSS